MARLTDTVNGQVARILEALEGMTNQEGVIPGTLLHEIVTGQDQEQSALALQAFVQDLLGCPAGQANALLRVVGNKVDFVGEAVKDIDSLG